jgi:opacity protein-like surface antigen
MIKPLMIAVSAMVFSSAALAAAHTAAPGTAPAKEDKTAAKPAGSATKDATGKTEANRDNKMSPTGQNETSSVGTSKKEAEGSGGSSMKSK